MLRDSGLGKPVQYGLFVVVDGFNPILQTGENEAIQHIIADIVHGALTEALSIFDTVIITIWDPVLLVLAISHCPTAISAFHQTGENLRCAVVPLSAAAGNLLLYPVKVGLAYNGFVGAFYLPPFIFGPVYPLFALE